MLDDNADLLAIYKRQLERFGSIKISAETDSDRARELAERQLFDVLIIDAKLQYKGVEFGGLRLADDLRGRYGRNAILVMSRYITAQLMRAYRAPYDFLEKPSSGESKHFLSELHERILSMRARQYVFIAMPFAPEHKALYKRLKQAVAGAGYRCVRVDELNHNRPIQELIFELVEESKIVLFVADGRNPNAYYEAGFADAMKKEVVILARALEELCFDVANRNTVVYGDDLSRLTAVLERKLRGLAHARHPAL